MYRYNNSNNNYDYDDNHNNNNNNQNNTFYPFEVDPFNTTPNNNTTMTNDENMEVEFERVWTPKVDNRKLQPQQLRQTQPQQLTMKYIEENDDDGESHMSTLESFDEHDHYNTTTTTTTTTTNNNNTNKKPRKSILHNNKTKNQKDTESLKIVRIVTPPNHMKDDDPSQHDNNNNIPWYKRRKTLCIISIITYLLLVGIIVAIVFSTKDKKKKKQKNNNNKSKTNNDPSYILSLEKPIPYSLLHPVYDLGVWDYTTRTTTDNNNNNNNNNIPPPTSILSTTTNNNKVLPTNAWYQNLLLRHDDNNNNKEPISSIYRVYTIPYIIDMATTGSIQGIRIRCSPYSSQQLTSATTTTTSSSSSTTNDRTAIQVYINEQNGLTLGATTYYYYYFDPNNNNEESLVSNQYNIIGTTELGIVLQWNNNNNPFTNLIMKSSLIRGMPYATMVYQPKTENNNSNNDDDNNRIILLPTITSQVSTVQGIVYSDNNRNEIQCMSSSNLNLNSISTTMVEEYIEVTFQNNNIWLIFVSRPIHVQCIEINNNNNNSGNEPKFMLQLFDINENNDNDNDNNNNTTKEERFFLSSIVTVRVALVNVVVPNTIQNDQSILFNNYKHLLKERSSFYPGDNPSIFYNIHQEDDDDDDNNNNEKNNKIEYGMDWNVYNMKSNELYPIATNDEKDYILMFALPHHLDTLQLILQQEDNSNNNSKDDDGKVILWNEFCTISIFGSNTCLIEGSKWTMIDDIPITLTTTTTTTTTTSNNNKGGVGGFNRAPRSPIPNSIPLLLQTLPNDLQFQVPNNFQNGAGDTYYSGKMVAKLSRIILIANEIYELCTTTTNNDNDNNNNNNNNNDYSIVCNNTTAIDSISPSSSTTTTDKTNNYFNIALSNLRSYVEIWINGTAQSPFVYDSIWGGYVNCGCNSDGIHCLNRVPDCPALYNDEFNFGNGFYNDQHFHYGYHIYAASVVAYFDKNWGRKTFEQVLLLIRNIANPSKHDPAFPIFRHKDWYQGHSWASGIIQPNSNGRNQESSSEAIASYEAITLYGIAMKSAWNEIGETGKATIADEIRKVGLVLTTMELRSTKKYWHVDRMINSESSSQQQQQNHHVYPLQYEPSIVGIVWNTKIEYRTWFGNAPYGIYGIQLLPLTPIAEVRDDISWVKQMYIPFAHECNADYSCVEDGWSILEIAMLATIGHIELAINRTISSLPDTVYESNAGNGHSLSNTIWYLATRPLLDEPFPLNTLGITINCYQPKLCTDDVLNKIADNFSCRDRIQWLIDNTDSSQWDACKTIADIQFPDICGPCNPSG